ncbi:hypothetical protein ThvES_00005770 [Thiovulum sp. ES]|nr:hypothetical protein ThvES_00005770 [Thiovulum sp. ES]
MKTLENMSFYDKLVYAFREILLYHHDSLEFRAKMYTVPILANPDGGDCEMEKVSQMAKEIYPKSRNRRNALLLTIKEYIDKAVEPNGLGIDELIFDLEKDLKRKSRFSHKIHIEHIEKLIECTTEENSKIYQSRILSLFTKLKKSFS